MIMRITTIKYGKLKKAKKISLVISVLLRERKKVLLVKRKKGKSFAGFWGLPNGKVRVGEKLEEAARREVKEETGLIVEILEPYHITQEFHDDHHHIVIAFKGRVISGKLKPGSDVEDARWFTKSEISKLKVQPTAREQIKTGF
jgi:8-oxo-dGTP diphosphatase